MIGRSKKCSWFYLEWIVTERGKVQLAIFRVDCDWKGKYYNCLEGIVTERRIWYYFHCGFLYIHTLLIDKELHGCQNVSIFSVLFYLCLSSEDLLIFSVSYPLLFPISFIKHLLTM